MPCFFSVGDSQFIGHRTDFSSLGFEELLKALHCDALIRLITTHRPTELEASQLFRKQDENVDAIFSVVGCDFRVLCKNVGVTHWPDSGWISH